jgi:hypothetical protein
MSSAVTEEPSHDPLGCAMASVVDEANGGEKRDGEVRGAEERPPVAPEWLRGGGGPEERLDCVRVRRITGVRRWIHAVRAEAKEQRAACERKKKNSGGLPRCLPRSI